MRYVAVRKGVRATKSCVTDALAVWFSDITTLGASTKLLYVEPG